MNEDNLAEEIFCLKYELNTLANVLLRNESERWVPGFLHQKTEHSHIERYKLACEYSDKKKVIDVACGIGKGSYLMATEGKAERVDGFDIQEEAIRYASYRNYSSNVKFELGDAESLNKSNEYDLAVSFETIEHLRNYKSFFSGVHDSLKPDGMLLISTPISSLPIDTKPGNPYHVQEWGFKEFHKILEEFFDIKKVFVQLYPRLPIQSPPVHLSIVRRIYNKIKKRLVSYSGAAPHVMENNSENGFSKIEEYTGQYPIDELGTVRIGYQIALVKKKPCLI